MRGANKYGAIPTVVDNIKFDSRAEAQYYKILKLLERAGEISELTMHPQFVLLDPFKKFGKKKGGIKYTADFMYKENGETVVVDVKGAIARDFSLRRTLFDSKFPDIKLKVVRKTDGRWEEK